MNRTIPLVLATLSFASAVNAQPIAYDGFAYTGGQSLSGQNGGFGFAGPWTVTSGTVQVQSGSLVPADPSSTLPESGNSVSATPASSITAAFANRTLATPIIGTPGTSAWVSVVMKGTGHNGLSAQGELSISDGSNVGFSISTGSTGSGTPPFNPPANANWSVTDAFAGNFTASSTVSDTIQSFLVANITFGAGSDVVNLYVNPALGGGPPATPDASVTLPHATMLNTVQLVYGALDAPASSTLFDEIRLGDTFTDVTTAAVPEPSALLLVGAAGLGLAVRRRKRKT